MQIEWAQVIVAFLLGVALSAMVKAFAGNLKSKAGL